jgi:putative membrane-bound dehydrogenase-like protein
MNLLCVARVTVRLSLLSAGFSAFLSGSSAAASPLPIDLPEGLVAEVAAAPPLVMHPMMAALGGPGQLFVCDAAGLNLNKADLEKQLPNRVLLLTDTKGNGIYDKVSVFADKMTFPQGAVWLDGSLYVASPPGIWKLTDTHGNGVADQRELIASYFDYTGNAADVHGPFLHPNGRLYWCHGRKGHTVKQKDGTLVHAGLASGIWSCKPDGSDIRWHALGCGDNPVEIDFTPEGEIIGDQNLFYSNPRGDTLVHWLRGGVYPREDQLQAIAGLPRTLETMPVLYNFGHTAVSGCAFYHSGALNPDWRGNLFVVQFNTQRVVRMEVTPDGASYKAVPREFLRSHFPDGHLTDVLEDRDGSLLVVNTGGWFRIGCPSSLVGKPEVAGAIYRVRRQGGPAKVEPWGSPAVAHVWELARKGDEESARALTASLASDDASVAHAAGNALAMLARPETEPALAAALNHRDAGVQLAAANALGALPTLTPQSVAALLHTLTGKVDPALEHQAMFALIHANQPAALIEALNSHDQPDLQRHALRVLDQLPASPLAPAQVLPLLRAPSEHLAREAATVIARHHDWAAAVAQDFTGWLTGGSFQPGRLALLEDALKPSLKDDEVRKFVTLLLKSSDPAQQRAGWDLLAFSAIPPEESWTAALLSALDHAAPADLPIVLKALANTGGAPAIKALGEFAADAKRPLALRLKALGASRKPGAPLEGEPFDLLVHVLRDPTAGSARTEAAHILATSKLAPDQLRALAAEFGALNAVELHELVKIVRQSKDPEVGRVLATALKEAPALGTLQESDIRTLFSGYPPEVFGILTPAFQALAAEDEGRRRKLETLPALIAAKGRPEIGRKIFETGQGGCIACHRIGDVGNFIGPNLSAIGQIRSERDILESILFPSATIAHDFEAQTIDTADGQSLTGIVRRNLPEAIVLVDIGGQEHTLPRAQITAMQMLPTSLMPVGLDHTLTEEQLLDLVAYLHSRKK